MYALVKGEKTICINRVKGIAASSISPAIM
jgi:hypothetical protein